jgi:hypothetical protein
MLLPDGSRKAVSTPYGRSSGALENSTPAVDYAAALKPSLAAPGEASGISNQNVLP